VLKNQNDPHQDASTHGRKASSWSDPHQAPPTHDLEHEFSGLEPPEFHCSHCDGLGVLFSDDGSWSFQKCPTHLCK